MTFLIAQLALWLTLTGVCAGFAGWSFAALRAQPEQRALRREREHLMRDLLAISVEGAEPGGAATEVERELDALRRRAELDAARTAEMARALAAARDSAQEAAGRVAELERHIERSANEVEHLVSVSDPIETPPADEGANLMGWRLRYFEQRVRYLESAARAVLPVAAASEPPAQAATAEVVAEAPALESPFAANAETDKLLRWRMLYLEKRVAHLHAEKPTQPRLGDVAESEETEKWKWRARYLEARTRHLERKLSATVTANAQVRPVAEAPPGAAEIGVEHPAAPAPLVPAGEEQRPAGLSAPRGGAGDDLSLIEGVSLLQHSTLNALGIHHFDQIAAWSPANIAWVDQYLRLRGRIVEEQWVEQARDLVRGGPAAHRPMLEDEDA